MEEVFIVWLQSFPFRKWEMKKDRRDRGSREGKRTGKPGYTGQERLGRPGSSAQQRLE